MAQMLLYVDGMTCGSCAARVDRALRSVKGVSEAAVNLTTGVARVEGQPQQQDLLKAIQRAGYGGRILEQNQGGAAEALQQVHARGQADEQRIRDRLIYGALFGIPAIAISSLLEHREWIAVHMGAKFGSQYVLLEACLATAVVFLTGWPFFYGAFRALRHGSANMDVLVALGAGVAWAASLWSTILWLPHMDADLSLTVPPIMEFHAAVMIILLVTLGKYLEARAKRVAASAVGSLAFQTAGNAQRLLPDGQWQTIPISHIAAGDRIQILAHQKIPVDGEVIEGAGSADLSVITGESVPAEIHPGTQLPGGATLADGRILLRAAASADASTVARIWDLVNAAQASKTHMQGLADKVAGIFVPIVVLLAIATFAGWIFFGAGWHRGLVAAIATVVIACPCAMGLATPTAITVALGTAAKRGILFTRAAALERAGRIHTVVFDKTGTLTEGKPTLSEVVSAQSPVASSGNSNGPAESPAHDQQEILRLAASLEQFSDHPLAHAIVNAAAQQHVHLDDPLDFSSAPGGGVRGRFADGHEFAAGSAAFTESLNCLPDEHLHREIDRLTQAGNSIVLLADLPAKKILGALAMKDALRPAAPPMLALLHDRGIRTGILSGDRQAAVNGALAQGGATVDFVKAGIKPEEKAAALRDLVSPNTQNHPTPPASRVPGVAFVGDGINDGPALATADLGIAMAGGTDLAKAAGDVLLLANRLAAVPEVLDLSRRTVRIIRQNLFWAFAYNIAAIPLAMCGLLPPGLAAAAMMCSSLTVVTNALRLRRPP